MSHTLLSLVDPETGNPFTDTQKRLAIFTKMLHGGLRHSSDFVEESYAHQRNLEINGDGRHSLGKSQLS